MTRTLRDSAAVLAVALFASGCTTTVVSPDLKGLDAAGRNSEMAGFAIKSPDLISCDDLACYYGPPQNYYIRNVHCPKGQVIASICDYERAKTDGVVLLGKAETPLVWTKARSSLSRTSKGLWRIGADSIEQRDKRND